jgi:Phosphotransferase enzyme family
VGTLINEPVKRAQGVATNLTALTELAAAWLPKMPMSGPSAAADVTTEWLTAEVAGDTPGAAALRATALDGTTGTTDRRRLAVEWNESGTAAGLPANLFIKSTPLTAKNRSMVAALGMAVNEARFYNQVATELPAVAPRAWYARASVGARFLIVLDDIVAAGGRPYALSDHCGLSHARGLIDAFAKLHARFWQSPRLRGDLSWVRTWSTRPGYGVLKQFYSRGRRGALRRDRPEVTGAVRAVATALDEHAEAFYREFESGPLTLLHGDSHLGNTFAWPDGTSGLLDWQVIWQGPGLREVSYWMTTGLEPDMRRTHEKDLIARYLEGLKAGGATDVPGPDVAFERYRLFAAEAWDATAMTINWPGLQAQQNADAAFRRTCTAVEDLETAAQINRLYR